MLGLLNYRRDHAGLLQTDVINPIYADKFFVSPWDTGAYAAAYGKQTPFGTLDHFYHLIQPHVKMYKKEMSGYGLDKIFERWYGGASVLKGGFFYFGE